MSVLTVLQARTTSTRLPGKVLEDLHGAPMLVRQIERLRRARSCSDLIVATSDHGSDDDLAGVCDRIGVACFRGSLNDVLDRFYQAARPHAPEHVIRLTGDCPLADPDIVDAIVDNHLQSGADYTSNTRPPTFPDGLDVEIVRFPVLQAAWAEALLPSEREHVMPFVTNRPERFRLANVAGADNLSALRWTVDEPSDLAFVRAIYGALYPRGADFRTAEILAFLRDNPDVMASRPAIERNAGLRTSHAADAVHLAGEG